MVGAIQMTDELINDIKYWLRLNATGRRSDRLTLDYIKMVIKRYEKRMHE